MDKTELELTAELAHIELSDDEKAVFSDAVSQMIEYFALMDEIEVGFENSEHHIPGNANAVRPDKALPSQYADDILEQAPDLEDRFIAIPNVL